MNSYRGVDSAGKTYSLAGLINKIAADVPGLKRLRYTTSHPKDVTDELIEAHRDIDILMPFVHLPVQSGSDRILAEMNRKYTVREYLDVIDRLRKARPDMAFSSDFIVGFPSETEADFQATIDVVKAVKYAQAYSFKYSPRPYTKAAVMPNQVLEATKEQRLAILQELLNSQQNEYNQASVGMTTDVLFEKKGKYANQLVGKTPYFQAISVDVSNSTISVGDIAKVKIVENLSHSLSGRLIDAI